MQILTLPWQTKLSPRTPPPLRKYCESAHVHEPQKKAISLYRNQKYIHYFAQSDAKYPQYTYNCKPIPDKDCYTGDGSSYSGTVSKTASGKTCLTWSNVYPFLPNNNHCRNYFAQYGITEPVCYMQAGTYYVESCGIPKCGEIVLLETH